MGFDRQCPLFDASIGAGQWIKTNSANNKLLGSSTPVQAVLTTDPSTATLETYGAGYTWFNSTSRVMKVWDGYQKGMVPALPIYTPEMFGAVGDGVTNDYTAIAAMYASLTSGGMVLFDAKTYLVSSPVYVSNNNIRTMGVGRASMLKLSGDVGDISILRLNADGLVVEDLTIDGNRSVNTSATQYSHAISIEAGKKKIKVQNCWLQNTMGDGVDIQKTSEDVQILNNWMIDNYRNGVSDVGGYRHTIRGNQIVSTSSNIVGCIDLEPNGDDVLEDILVSGNTIYITGTKPYGIDIALDKVTTDSKLKNIRVTNNIIHGDATDGPTVGIYGYGARNVTIQGNEVYGAVQDGIYLDDGATNASKDCSIDGNTVVSSGRYGIGSEADNTHVRNNIVRLATKYGMYFRGTVGGVFTGNHVYVLDSATYAVLFDVAGITDFTFAGNQIEASAVGSNQGVRIERAANAKVYGNTIKNFSTGLLIGTTSYDTVYAHDNQYIGCTTNSTNSSRTVIGTINLSNKGTSLLYSAAGAVTATLPDGDETGTIKIIRMSNATATSTVSVTHHETSDPEVFSFGAVTDILILMWNGLEWVTINNQGVDTP